jgi:hypothetical protein
MVTFWGSQRCSLGRGTTSYQVVLPAERGIRGELDQLGACLGKWRADAPPMSRDVTWMSLLERGQLRGSATNESGCNLDVAP